MINWIQIIEQSHQIIGDLQYIAQLLDYWGAPVILYNYHQFIGDLP